MLAENLVNPLGGPKIGLKAEAGSGLENYGPPLLQGHLLELSRAATAGLTCQSLEPPDWW